MSSTAPGAGDRVLDLPGGLRTRLIDEGAGPVALLLHGNPDNADEWRPLIERLRGSFRCLAPDLPGYGRRGETQPLPPSFDYSREAQVGFVDAVLAAVGVEGDITLVVHDIGGIMGVPWAAANLARLRAVAYTNTVAFPDFQWFDLALRWGAEGGVGRWLAELSMAALGAFDGALFRRAFGRQNPQLDAQGVDRFVTHFALNPQAKATTLVEFRQLTRRPFFDGYDGMLQAIAAAVPTVTVWGEGDPYVRDRYAEQLLARELVRLPGVGHWVPLIGAEPLAEAVRGLG